MIYEEGEKEWPRFGFLLGAGASRPASVPDMKEFYTSFLTKMKNERPDMHAYLKDILGRIIEEENSDLEELMIILQTLANQIPYNDIIQKIRPLPGDLSANVELANEALLHLEQYIAERTFINDPSKIQYLSGLSDLIRDLNYYPPIFTVNYDTIIELLCLRKGIKCVDGFNPYWDSSLFNDEDGIHLFKLHGSCTWYSSGPTYVKLPTGPNPIHLELLGGGKTQNILLYPAFTKNRSNEPLSVLLDFFRRELAQLKILFIVGYSCRDPDISMAIAEGMRENPDLRIYLITKHPTRCLELLAEVEPRLRESVICLSTTWDLMLESGRLGRLISDYTVGYDSFRRWQINSRYGQISSSIEKAEELRQSFQYQQLDELYQTVRYIIHSSSGYPDQLLFETSVGLLYRSILYNDVESTKEYSNSLLRWIDKNIRGADETISFQSIIQSIPPEFSQRTWESNINYRLRSTCRFPLYKWAEWIKPYLHDEIFSNNLSIISDSVQFSYDDFDSLDTIIRALETPRGSDKRSLLSQSEKSIKATVSRLSLPITIDELVRFVPDDEKLPLVSVFDRYKWISTIFFDGVDNTKIFYSTLISLTQNQ